MRRHTSRQKVSLPCVRRVTEAYIFFARVREGIFGVKVETVGRMCSRMCEVRGKDIPEVTMRSTSPIGASTISPLRSSRSSVQYRVRGTRNASGDARG